MVIGSHNAWSYLKPKKWWMKLIRFTARCQKYDVVNQYLVYGSRCFDLRAKFPNDKLVIAHGIVEYDYTEPGLMKDLRILSDMQEKVYIRVIHEIRNKKELSSWEYGNFNSFCKKLERCFPNLIFFGGQNLIDYTEDYHFENNPSMDEKYSSVCPPRLLDDWFPWLYACFNNKKNVKTGTDKDILLIDFVNIK